MRSINPIELVFMLAVVLLILRPRRLTEAVRALGRRAGVSPADADRTPRRPGL